MVDQARHIAAHSCIHVRCAYAVAKVLMNTQHIVQAEFVVERPASLQLCSTYDLASVAANILSSADVMLCKSTPALAFYQ